MLVFVEGGKPESPEKTLGARMRTNNKLNPHMMSGPGIEPSPHWWEGSELTATPPLLPRTVGFQDDIDNTFQNLRVHSRSVAHFVRNSFKN